MKKIAAILAVLFAVTIQPVHAETPKTLVIIDTGVDMSYPALNNIVYEVCVAGYKSCPNGQNFMEGKGAANVTSSMYSNEAWSHGTKVASLASSIPVIEIRCASLIGTNGLPAKYGGFETLTEYIAINLNNDYDLYCYCSKTPKKNRLNKIYNTNLIC